MKICVDSPAKLEHWREHFPDIKLGDIINTGRGRFGNISKRVVDNITFDSTREADRYVELKLLVAAKEIRELKVHPRFDIIIGGVPILFRSKRYPKGRQMVYVADFSYILGGKGTHLQDLGLVIEDVKMQSGHRTEVYKIKRALMAAMAMPITEY